MLSSPIAPALGSSSQPMNALEPASLADVFRAHPPEGFRAFGVPIDAGDAPAFYANFDVLTTLDDEQRWIIDWVARLKLGWLTRMPTVFSGTTVTEYSTYPSTDVEGCKLLVDALLKAGDSSNARLVIIKDLPHNSPLLSDRENRIADEIARTCAEDGRFIVMEGQALAYIPIDFSTIDEYLARASKAKRRDLRRKLRARSELSVETLATGSAFEDDTLVGRLHELYLNVYDQSKYHFDKLSLSFFRETLTDEVNGGVVFLYRKDNRLIGFNIGFEYNGRLMDKYVGFEYPAAREANLYFVSWFDNLEYALRRGLSCYIAGCGAPEVKASLGANFTTSRHIVYVRNKYLRKVFVPLSRFFENDTGWNDDQVAGRGDTT